MQINVTGPKRIKTATFIDGANDLTRQLGYSRIPELLFDVTVAVVTGQDLNQFTYSK